MIFIFSIIVGLQCSVNFLLYSKVTQSHTTHILFLILYSMFHHEWLDIVPSWVTRHSSHTTHILFLILYSMFHHEWLDIVPAIWQELFTVKILVVDKGEGAGIGWIGNLGLTDVKVHLKYRFYIRLKYI